MSKDRSGKGISWDVFSTNSDDGAMQIQRVDCPDTEGAAYFQSDEDAIMCVLERACYADDVVCIEALWEVLDHDGLVNRVLWQQAEPSIESTAYPDGFAKRWGHLQEDE